MSKTVKAIIGVFLIIVIIGALSGNKKTEEPKVTPTPIVEVKPTTAPTNTPVPTESLTNDEMIMAVYRSAFVDGCTDGDASKTNNCRCMFNYLMDNYGLEKILEATQKENASTNLMFIKAAAECYND